MTTEINFEDLKVEAGAREIPLIDEREPDYKASEEKPQTKSKLFNTRPKTTAAPKRGRPAKKTVAPYRKGMFVEPLMQMYSMIGAALMLKDPPVAKAILEQARPCAESLDELAKQNEAVRAALIAMTTTGAWSAVAIAHAPILFAILATHVPAVKQQLEFFAPPSEPDYDESV